MNNKTEEGHLLPLMEEFYTLQGEGFHTGKAAYFIRIGGCDVGCHWCDVKESWDKTIHPMTSADHIVANALKYSDTVVVTGGEPLQWNMDYLTRELQKHHIKVHLETSGSSALTGHWNWICLSPKKNKLPLPEIYTLAHELKIIIRSKQDFTFAEEQAALVNNNCQLYLQPEWSKKDKMTPLIIDYILEHPQWKISIQTHKFIHIP
ncbi:MAG: 7-carboxy-7-deazaguanine synthase QueE [Flavobacteriales bacterium]|nr:MAG: 7-carboxy-7-deazaguanine synthase QueE [Flavobacteriales bacterium]